MRNINDTKSFLEHILKLYECREEKKENDYPPLRETLNKYLKQKSYYPMNLPGTLQTVSTSVCKYNQDRIDGLQYLINHFLHYETLPNVEAVKAAAQWILYCVDRDSMLMSSPELYHYLDSKVLSGDVSSIRTEMKTPKFMNLPSINEDAKQLITYCANVKNFQSQLDEVKKISSDSALQALVISKEERIRKQLNTPFIPSPLIPSTATPVSRGNVNALTTHFQRIGVMLPLMRSNSASRPSALPSIAITNRPSLSLPSNSSGVSLLSSSSPVSSSVTLSSPQPQLRSPQSPALPMPLLIDTRRPSYSLSSSSSANPSSVSRPLASTPFALPGLTGLRPSGGLRLNRSSFSSPPPLPLLPLPQPTHRVSVASRPSVSLSSSPSAFSSSSSGSKSSSASTGENKSTSQNEENVAALFGEFKDLATLEIFKIPVIINCGEKQSRKGHILEKDTAEQLLRDDRPCPACREPFTQFYIDRDTRNFIDRLLMLYPEYKDDQFNYNTQEAEQKESADSKEEKNVETSSSSSSLSSFSSLPIAGYGSLFEEKMSPILLPKLVIIANAPHSSQRFDVLCSSDCSSPTMDAMNKFLLGISARYNPNDYQPVVVDTFDHKTPTINQEFHISSMAGYYEGLMKAEIHQKNIIFIYDKIPNLLIQPQYKGYILKMENNNLRLEAITATQYTNLPAQIRVRVSDVIRLGNQLLEASAQLAPHPVPRQSSRLLFGS